MVLREVGRLALRIEGTMWNAYYMRPDSAEDAIWLGSIAKRFVENNPERKEQFIALMQAAMDECFEELFGHKAESWTRRPAPEHERTKK